jgi:hypothetical protein
MRVRVLGPGALYCRRVAADAGSESRLTRQASLAVDDWLPVTLVNNDRGDFGAEL